MIKGKAAKVEDHPPQQIGNRDIDKLLDGEGAEEE